MTLTLPLCLAALLLGGCAAGSGTAAPPSVTVTWVGTTAMTGRTRVPDSNSPTGFLGGVTSWAPASDASPIRAGVGTSMGVAFTLSNTGRRGPIPVQVTWTFPAPGMRPQGLATAPWRTERRTTQYCMADEECLAGWTFSDPWEVVPGTWTVELAIAGKTFLRQQLDVVAQ